MVSSSRFRSMDQDADALRRALNRWAHDDDLRSKLDLLAVDTMFSFGVGLVTQEPVVGGDPRLQAMANSLRKERARRRRERYEDAPIMWPVAHRLAQDCYFHDHVAAYDAAIRFRGHKFDADLEDLIENAENTDDGWIISELLKLPDAETDDPSLDSAQRRKQVTIHEIWVPEIEHDDGAPEDGYHGTIYTLAGGKAGGVFVREPRPYWGPRTGPYTLFGIYKVPGQTYPLSPIVASDSQLRELSAHARAMSDSNKRYRQVALYDEHDKESARRINSARHQQLIGIKGLDKQKIVPLELGGTTRQQHEFYMHLRQQSARSMGMDEAQTGNVTGDATATENAIADEAASARLEYIAEQFTDGVRRLSGTAAYFLDQDDLSVGILDPTEDGEGGIYWGGGFVDTPFEEKQIRIEPYSLGRTSQQQLLRQAADLDALVLNYGPLIPSMPWVRHKEYMRQRAQLQNAPGLEEIFDYDMASEFAGAQPEEDPQRTELQRQSAHVQAPKPLATRPAPQAPQPSGDMAQFAGKPAGQQAAQGIGV